MVDILIQGAAIQDQFVLGSLKVPKFVGSITVQVQGSPFKIKQDSIGKDFVVGVHDANGLFDSHLFTSALLVLRKPTQRQDQAVTYSLIVDTTLDPTLFNLRRIWDQGDLASLTPGIYSGEIDIFMGSKLITAPDADSFEFTLVESLN